MQTIQGLIGWDAVGRPNGSYLLEQYQGGKIHVVAPATDPNKDADPRLPHAELVSIPRAPPTAGTAHA